MERDVKVML